VDPLGRHILEQEQQHVATVDKKKEGWAKGAGIDPKEYFANIKTPADLAQAPPFTLKDIHAAVPKHLWEKNGWKSMAYLGRDILQVVGLAFVATKAAALMPAWAAALTVWPAYAALQGLVFWGLFVVGHDCGHQSFSNSRKLNDFVGNIVHSFILVPYHQWRISHRKHHGNHGHVENDESWTPMTKTTYDGLNAQAKLGRFTCPIPLLAYPLYLAMGTPDKPGSHYDPNNKRLFAEGEKKLVVESNLYNLGMVGLLAAATAKFGLLSVATYYFAPWLVYIALLDAVTYLHHHGHHDADHPMPWYRGEEWSYLRGGLTCLDRDYGILNNLHHDIGTHVIHHLYPQMPHYNLLEATQHLKKAMGPYYRQPEPCPGPKINGGYTEGGISLGLPTHLIKPLFRSFNEDKYVNDNGDVLFYKTDPDNKEAPKPSPAVLFT
jgi:omega-3 fatty acid desaturase (delta-15 desaturase)